jgi:hypothetical protein
MPVTREEEVGREQARARDERRDRAVGPEYPDGAAEARISLREEERAVGSQGHLMRRSLEEGVGDPAGAIDSADRVAGLQVEVAFLVEREAVR